MANPCRMKAEAVRERMAVLGLTQAELAERCGLELRTLQRWMAGGRVSVDDAERIARALGLGTRLCFDGVPIAHLGSPFARVAPFARLLSRSDEALSQAFKVVLDQFSFVDRHTSFIPHPPDGYVQRLAIPRIGVQGFERLTLQPSVDRRGSQRITFAAQVGRRFRYEFGEIRIEGEQLRLVEHFHTRALRALRAADGSFALWVWISPELRELVVVSDADFRLWPIELGRRLQTFDSDAPDNRHALCFRPSAMHLRAAGLEPSFDRMLGRGRTPDEV
jgi:transcriptional regulator with XRE-family HTH domain